MVKVIIDFISETAIDEKHLMDSLCNQKDSIYHESEILIKEVDDQEFSYQLEEWMKNN